VLKLSKIACRPQIYRRDLICFSEQIELCRVKFIVTPVSDAAGILGDTKRIVKFDLVDLCPLKSEGRNTCYAFDRN